MRSIEIEFLGDSIKHIFFLEKGMGSITTTFSDGTHVEVGMFGYESVIGISALMGSKQSLNRVYMQLAGWGFSTPVKTARAEFDRYKDFHHLALRYVRAQLIQAAQSTGCNAKHGLHQRLACWLLICADRANTTKFPMSQEFLSHTLGVTRTSVSATASELKDQGLIDYKRGVISVPDRKALERKACECYLVVKRHLDNHAQFDTDFVL